MKMSVLSSGCVRKETIEFKFIKELNDYGIERASILEESDYLLYITCAGVGETILKCL